MTVFQHPKGAEDQEVYWYWQCDFCLKTSKPLSFAGYWEGRMDARDDLDKHRIEKHNGLIWKDRAATVLSLKKDRKARMKKGKK